MGYKNLNTTLETKTDEIIKSGVEELVPILKEANLFLASDNSIPPGIENVADDSEGDIRFLEELLIDDSILSHESSDSNFEDNPSIPRPPPEPSDAETDAGEEILVDFTLRGIDFDSEEIENFLNDDSIPLGVKDSPFNMEEDILFLEKSSTKNLVPILHESEVTLENGSKSIEPVKDESLVFTTILNPFFDDDKINSDELNSHVESNSVESTSNHNTVKFDNLDEFSGPLIPIYIIEEERIRREHMDYINRMEMLFTINPRPHPSTCANTNIESFSSLPIPIQDSDPHQEEIDVVTSTDDVLPPGVENDDSDGEFDAIVDLLPLPPPEPPDEEFDFEIAFEKEISVVRNIIVKFECIDARIVFNDENNDLSYFMLVIFAKVFSFLSAKSEDTIFDHGIFD
nr:hypothetical protein [Tanacetum cinerariifolium]